uniref:N-acetylglucosaminylphosphatidylinositol deacetylase n=1 Tax=Piliocolobus tephrosceles TaxID=591936 RepID=A0A8C9LH81_9PRIM
MNYLVITCIVVFLGIIYNIIQYYLNIKEKIFLQLFKENENIALVIAHPDDEVMFFFPVLKLLFKKKKKNELFILTFSNGNFYNQGKIREKEFYNVWSYLGGEKKNCHIVEDLQIQDGWVFWKGDHIKDILKSYCKKNKIKKILTFDSFGVSGHPNHQSVYRGARLLSKSKDIQIFTLNSSYIIFKYLGPLSFPFLAHNKYTHTYACVYICTYACL